MCRSPSPGKWEGCDRKGIRLKICAPTTHFIMSESQQPLVRGKRLTIINDDDDDEVANFNKLLNLNLNYHNTV